MSWMAVSLKLHFHEFLYLCMPYCCQTHTTYTVFACWRKVSIIDLNALVCVLRGNPQHCRYTLPFNTLLPSLFWTFPVFLLFYFFSSVLMSINRQRITNLYSLPSGRDGHLFWPDERVWEARYGHPVHDRDCFSTTEYSLPKKKSFI